MQAVWTRPNILFKPEVDIAPEGLETLGLHDKDKPFKVRMTSHSMSHLSAFDASFAFN